MISAVAGAYAVVRVPQEVAGGMPTRDLPLFAGGMIVVAAGSALLAAMPYSPPRPQPVLRVWAGTGMAVFVVVAGLLFAGAVGVERLPVDATTAAAVDGSPVVHGPSLVAWTWQAPPGHALAGGDVVPAGPGVAVRLPDGVVALDGRTGAERWHYRRVGAVADQIGASPSGDWVMVALRPSDPSRIGVQLVALDGRTGEIGFNHATESRMMSVVGLNLTDHVLVGTDYVLLGSDPSGGGRFEGYDLANGDRLWRWQPPEGCVVNVAGRGFAALADTVVVSATCERRRGGRETTGEVLLIGLDDRTGQERWRYAQPFTAGLLSFDGPAPVRTEVRPVGDRSLVMFQWHTDGTDGSGSALLAGSTGRVVAGQLPETYTYLDGEVVVGPVDGDEGGTVVALTRLDSGERTVLPDRCGEGLPEQQTVRVADTLVTVCYEGADLSVSISVLSLSRPVRPDWIAVDLGPFVPGSASEARVYAYPYGTVVAGRGRVVGLG